MASKKGKRSNKRNEDWESEVTDDIDKLNLENGNGTTNDSNSKNNDNEEETIVSKPLNVSVFSLLNTADDGLIILENDSSNLFIKDEQVQDDHDDSDDEVVEKEQLQIKSELNKGAKKMKKGKKKKQINLDDDIDQLLAEIESGQSGPSVQKSGSLTKVVQVTTTPAATATTTIDMPADDGEGGQEDVEDEVDGGSAMKTAAEKRKEKKDRDAEKRRKQKEKEKAKKAAVVPTVEDDNVDAAVGKDDSPVIDKESTKPSGISGAEVVDGAESGDDQDDNKKTKKDKKKKKGTEKEEKKGKIGKGQLKLMQEVLKQQEEEKRKQEEAVEAEDARKREQEQKYLDKIQREKEKKDKKKQREKDRVARLKAEGKYLTADQRMKMERQRQMVDMLKAQGLVPHIVAKEGEQDQQGSGTIKRPKYVDKRKLKLKQQQQQKEGDDVTNEKTELEVQEPIMVDDDDVKVKNEIDNKSDTDDILEDWEKIGDSPKKVEKQASGDASVSDEGSDSESGSEESSSDTEQSSEEHEKPSLIVEKIQPVLIPTNESKEQREERVISRLKCQFTENESKRNPENLRSPVICVLGHVDTGKTKILDKIRHTNVQDGEAGGITQQIGATFVPADAIKEQTKMVKDIDFDKTNLPGLLIIDTPGHESFSNLRTRGSSLCDIAILVVDIMHGLEQQTLESLNLLVKSKTPFVIALNKIDRLYEWQSNQHKDVRNVLKGQKQNCTIQFLDRCKDVIRQFAEQGINVLLFSDQPKKDWADYYYMVPTSALSGDGMGNLIAFFIQYLLKLSTLRPAIAQRLIFSENLDCKVMEVKAMEGMGTTIDVILVHGRLRVGDTIVTAGTDGPIVTNIRELVMPKPLREIRVKSTYDHFKEVKAAQGIKVSAKDLDKAMAGLTLYVAQKDDEIEILKKKVADELSATLQSIKLSDRGVYVQASTLGSLEALLEFLRTEKIPYSGINIGPVHKKDVMKASAMLEHEEGQYAMILGFDVRVERDAQEMADQSGVRIFTADIIYHLCDNFMKFRADWMQKKRDAHIHLAIFPCKLKIMPEFVFKTRSPIIVGVNVESGVLKKNTPICVPSKEFVFLGVVTSIQMNRKDVEIAKKGEEVCIKIECTGSDAPKMFGRHFDETDLLVSRITRETIDVCKKYFRNDLQKSDWQLMVELKKIFDIV